MENLLREQRREGGRQITLPPNAHRPLYSFLPVKLPSPISPNLTLPFIVSLSTVPSYSTSTSCPCALTLVVNLISLPLTVPSSGDSPNRPLYVPVNFSPSCFKTSEGPPEPFGVSMVNFQLPVTFVDCAPTVNTAAKTKAAVMMVMEAVMCLRSLFTNSPCELTFKKKWILPR